METGESSGRMAELAATMIEAARDGNGLQEPQEDAGDANGPSMVGDTDTRVCAALLVAKDVTEAARLAGVSRPTVYTRLKDPDFMERLERERAALLEDVRGVISSELAIAARDALDALASIAKGEPTPGFMGFDEYPTATDRIKASEALLRFYGTASQ